MSDNKSTDKKAESSPAKVAEISQTTKKAEAKTEAPEEKVDGASTETTAGAESKITEVVVPGKVKVKNIFKRNIHVEAGKIKAGEEGWVTPAEVEAENTKDPEDRRFLEV